jgi:hypothetical protein
MSCTNLERFRIPRSASRKKELLLVDEKEDAKDFYLGTKNLELKNSQMSWFMSGSLHRFAFDRMQTVPLSR